MNTFLRGPAVSRLLTRLDIHPTRFWLLMDLFATISDRGEMFDQLGRDGVALKTVSWLYSAMSALMTILFLVVQRPASEYFVAFLSFTSLLMLSVLVSETGNSLVNPVEALVLSHQPINGSTYTAAKLTHLGRMILYFVPALNLVPALGGLLLPDASWLYPLLHLSAAFAVGIVAALCCCALFGWLIRFVPPRRLKSAGQLAAALPVVAFVWMGQVQKLLAHADLRARLPRDPAILWSIAALLSLAAIAAVVSGIRSLSSDFLIRVSGMVRGGSTAGARPRSSWTASMVSRFFGGQPSRAGFSFVSSMMLRDFQFRRQLVPLIFPMLIGLGSLFGSGWRNDPLAGGFTSIHFLPHLFGFLLFPVCSMLPYGSDYKGAWILLLAPSRAIPGFARGVHAALWLPFILTPNLLLLPLLVWAWGVVHASLFAAFSITIGSIYLALQLQLIEGAPFTKPLDPSRGASLLVVMMVAGVGMGVLVGLQHFLIFHSLSTLAISIGIGVIAAALLTRYNVRNYALSIRYNLSLASAETGALFQEIAS